MKQRWSKQIQNTG